MSSETRNLTAGYDISSILYQLWIAYAKGQSFTWHDIATSYFVDPVNAHGLASDSNSGTSDTTPFLTTAKMNQVLFFASLVGTTTIKYLSDDDSEVPLDRSFIRANGFMLNVNGSQQVLNHPLLSTVITGTVNMLPPTGQRSVLNVGSPSISWAQYTLVAQGGTSTFPCFAVEIETGVTAVIVRAASPSGVYTGPPKDASGNLANFTLGHHIAVVRGSYLTAVASGSDLNGAVSNAFNSITFLANSTIGPLDFASQCSFLGSATYGCVASNCAFAAGLYDAGLGPSALILSGCTLVATANDFFTGGLFLADQTYVTGYGITIGSNAYSDVNVISYIGVGAGAQFQDCTGPALTILHDANIGAPLGNLADALLWGTGNLIGARIGPGASLTVSGNTGFVPTVTGSEGDFDFIQYANSTSSQARWWDDSAGAGAGAWSAQFDTSWAGLSSTHFQAQFPATNAAVIALGQLPD